MRLIPTYLIQRASGGLLQINGENIKTDMHLQVLVTELAEKEFVAYIKEEFPKHTVDWSDAKAFVAASEFGNPDDTFLVRFQIPASTIDIGFFTFEKILPSSEIVGVLVG